MKTNQILIVVGIGAGLLLAYHLYQKSQQAQTSVGNATNVNVPITNGNADQRNEGIGSQVQGVVDATNNVVDGLADIGRTFGGF